MPTDEDIESALRDAMRVETEALHAVAGLAEVARRKAVRRTWATRAYALVPVAVAAATAIALGAGAGTNVAPRPPAARAGSATVTPGSPTPPVELAAYVVRQVTDAVSGTTFVEFSTGLTGSGRVLYQRTWTDQATRRYRSDNYQDGRVTSSVALTHEGTKQQYRTFVNYQRRVWSSGPYPADTDITPLDVIRDGLASGQLKVEGHEQVNGHDTLHLSVTNGTYRAQWWVDTSSYLPYRIMTSTGAGSAADTILNIEWLPRTPENLAHLDLPAPPGFTRVSGPS